MAFSPSQPALLLVEGKDDRAFFDTLRMVRNLPAFEIIQYEGKSKLRPFLKGLVLAEGFSNVVSLGVVRDADDNPAAAADSIRGALQAAGLPVPVAALTAVGTAPRVAFMIVPDATSSGALEELCFRAFAGDPALPCVDQYFDCLAATGLPHPKDPKHRMRILLASRPEFRPGLAMAIESGYVPVHADAFDQAAQFVETFNS